MGHYRYHCDFVSSCFESDPSTPPDFIKPKENIPNIELDNSIREARPNSCKHITGAQTLKSIIFLAKLFLDEYHKLNKI